ncbi:MAG TPA: hypothetical protein DCS76_08170 [Gemmatimonadetes bacterium]|nr:hypothetical protein [Gemmatimonadota bacterium]
MFVPDNGVELVDDMTVRFNLKRSHVDFPLYMAGQLGYVPSLEYMKAAVEDPTLNQAPVGTGPFMFDSREQDYMTRLVRNPDWWQGDVYLDAVEFYIYTDTVLAADALAVGDVDAVHSSNLDAILSLREIEGAQIFETDDAEETFGMLNASKAPFDDIRARKALALSVAKDDYMEFIGQGVLRSADSWFPAESLYHNPDVVQVHDSPDQAAPLVAEYCADLPENCSDGRINMEFQYSGPSVLQERVYDILSAGWEPYFNITKDMLLQDDHITQTAVGQYDWVTWRQMGVRNPDADVTWINCEAIGVLSLNWPRLCDPARDDLLYTARASTDLDERIAIWQQVAEKVSQDYTYIMFTHTLWTHVYGPNVRGMCTYTQPGGTSPQCHGSGYFTRPSALWIEG